MGFGGGLGGVGSGAGSGHGLGGVEIMAVVLHMETPMPVPLFRHILRRNAPAAVFLPLGRICFAACKINPPLNCIAEVLPPVGF
jgi:hypothetical protein